MALVAWSEDFSVGHKLFDDQHSALFSYVNELHSAMMKGHGRAMIGGLLGRLLEYTCTHFADEERVLAVSDYPGLEQHKNLHRAFAIKVEDYKTRQEKGDLTVTHEVATFLSDWLSNHIQKINCGSTSGCS